MIIKKHSPCEGHIVSFDTLRSVSSVSCQGDAAARLRAHHLENDGFPAFEAEPFAYDSSTPSKLTGHHTQGTLAQSRI